MKKLLLLSLAFLVGFVAFSQSHKMNPGFKAEKAVIQNMIAGEPAAAPLKQLPVRPSPKPVNNDNDKPNDIVTILTIGTAANGLGYGYNGGQKTMVWADDNLKTVVNIHRMGPGSTPPSFSGYLAGDLGTNYGATDGDWQKNRQIYAATLNLSGTYYADAARYPQGGIYNPPGNTDLSNAWVTYFAPNLSNVASTWGARSYGVDNCVNQADSTKHLYWFDPPPYTYIPDGFAISSQGVVLVTDIDQEWSGTTFVGYQDDIVVNRGTWNTSTNDFDYTMFTVPFPTTASMRPSNDRVAFSPDGQTAWMVILSNNMTNLDSNIYPIVSKSVDAGQTWSAPMDVVLDGPTGIPGITQHLLSDYRIEQVFTAPVPNRDEIPYTTGFDCRISVDKWGNPHIGVVVGICAGGYAISIPNGPPPNAYDSTFAVYDIYSVDGGVTWSGQLMGYLSSFRGDFVQSGSAITEDNRTCIASNMVGDKMFLSWNDTQEDNYINNNDCDIFSRGFDLVENKITKNVTSNNCEPDNVTFLSDVFLNATFQCMSYYVFSDYPAPNRWTLPIVSQLLSVQYDLSSSVEFKYVSDFSYAQDDFVCDVFPENPGFPTGINESRKNAAFDMTIFPNPFKGASRVSVTVPKSGNLSMDITNIVGQKMMSVEKGFVNAGQQSFAIDGSQLATGVYFCTIRLDDLSTTRKMIIK